MPVYSDLTYQISSTDRRRRPNPRVISNTVLRGPSGLPSFRNHTALFTYFGKFTYSASAGLIGYSMLSAYGLDFQK